MRYREQRRTPQPPSATPWPRLVTMIGMLAVVFVIMSRAKDPSMWRWLTNQSESEFTDTGDAATSECLDSDTSYAAPIGAADSDERPIVQSSSEQTDSAGPGRDVDGAQQDGQSVGAESTGSTDLDPEEADAAREEFQAITDRQPLLPEEMPGYWRLLNWVQHQPASVLRRRSQDNVYFTDFVQATDKYRGKLVHLRLHVWGTHTYETPESPVGIGRLYEARGWTDQSTPWLYIVVTPDWPQGMPVGPNVREEVSFDGYFFKLMSYEARQSPGKPLFAPLLVGRMVWHPVRTAGGGGSGGTWFWATILGGGLIMLIVILRWVIVSRHHPVAAGDYSTPRSAVSVEEWLARVEASGSEEQNDSGAPGDGSENSEASRK